jgi:fucose 4-O-acetylase-like acetyltransferase
MKQRNVAIDILKGIGIILVLTAHALGGFVSQFAYTFHMPLFFIVTGLFISVFTTTEGDGFTAWWKGRALKDFKRLINPALFTMAVILMVSSLSYVLNGTYLQNPVSLIWNDAPYGKLNYVNMLGNLWFLFALFFAKQLFYALEHLTEKGLLAAVCLVVGLAAVIIRQWFDLPFEVLSGACVLPFVWGGYYLKQHGGVETGLPRWFYLTIPFWITFIFWGKGRIGAMAPMYYVPYIVSACGGTLFFYHVSKVIAERTRYLSRCLAFLGVYSLILICAPSIESYCFPMQEIMPELPFRRVFVIAGKVGWCALAVYACIKVPFLQKVFGVKKQNNLS